MRRPLPLTPLLSYCPQGCRKAGPVPAVPSPLPAPNRRPGQPHLPHWHTLPRPLSRVRLLTVPVFVVLRSQASRGGRQVGFLPRPPPFSSVGLAVGATWCQPASLPRPGCLRPVALPPSPGPMQRAVAPDPALTSHPRGPVQGRLLLVPCPGPSCPCPARQTFSRGHDRGRLLGVWASPWGSPPPLDVRSLRRAACPAGATSARTGLSLR